MLLLALSGLAAGAADTDGEDAPAAALPSGYWLRPLAGQGEAPQAWSEIERSLAPEACRECHAEQYGEWRTSAHAGAFSPGLVGQLLTFNATQTAMCMNCHAPLSEQKQAFEAARSRGEAHLPVAQELAAAGNSCAGCHVRSQRRFGPPERDTGRIGPSDAEAPHGGVLRTADFESSEFCSSCHQFPQAWAVNGKPLQNTYVEWRASPQAAQGITCQSCHMPDRKHLWRGIHDPAMVTSGLTARFDTNSQTARFTLTNSGIGHAFPTYVTPKVTMHGVALDATGKPRPETAASHDIQRVVAFTGGRWVESSDTRLLPGESATVEVPWGDGERVRMWLEVHPDDYYDHQVYDPLLANSPPASQAARLITEADTLARASRYRLFETELPRPD
jgi:hypothetical protein